MAREIVILAVRDSAMRAFMTPIFVPSTGLAVRSFRDEVNREDSPMHKHPSDYELYIIGSFNEDDGSLTPLKPELLIRGKDVIEGDQK